MMNWTRVLAIAAIFAVSIQAEAKQLPAPGEPVTWHAVSKTAQSITGDVVILPNSIAFANGATLNMTAQSNGPAPWAPFGDEAGGDGEIYKLDTPADPELLNGNKLCGMPDQNVTYVMIAPSPKGDEMMLGVFTDKDLPTAQSSPCATYAFEL